MEQESYSTRSDVLEAEVGNILHRFLTDNAIKRQEVNFSGTSINSSTNIPDAADIQKHFNEAGNCAMCIGSFNEEKHNLMSISFLPGFNGRARMIATIYKMASAPAMNELLGRITAA